MGFFFTSKKSFFDILTSKKVTRSIFVQNCHFLLVTLLVKSKFDLVKLLDQDLSVKNRHLVTRNCFAISSKPARSAAVPEAESDCNKGTYAAP